MFLAENQKFEGPDRNSVSSSGRTGGSTVHSWLCGRAFSIRSIACVLLPSLLAVHAGGSRTPCPLQPAVVLYAAVVGVDSHRRELDRRKKENICFGYVPRFLVCVLFPVISILAHSLQTTSLHVYTRIHVYVYVYPGMHLNIILCIFKCIVFVQGI